MIEFVLIARHVIKTMVIATDLIRESVAITIVSF